MKDTVIIASLFYRPSQIDEEASISFHITAREKHDIKEAAYLPENQAKLQRFLQLLDE